MIFFVISILKNGQAIALTAPIDEYQASEPVNNQPITFSAAAKIDEGKIPYLPIFMLTNSLKLKMASDPKSDSIVLKKDNRWIRFDINKQIVSTSMGMREHITIVNKNNNYYLPMEFVASFFGYDAQLTKETAIPPLREQETKNSPIHAIPLQSKIELPKVLKPEKPAVYLTFDDGPNQYLNNVLDILKAKNAKGTFFMIEPQIRQYPDAVKRLVAEGHYPALHSVTHDKNKLYDGSPLNVVNEMEQTRKTLLEVTGVDSKLARAPYGSKPFMTEPFRKALANEGMKLWDWNIDSMDWKYQRSNPHQILTNIQEGLESVKNKQGPIVILMHVTKGTAEVLPQVIDYLYSKGYECPAYNPEKHVRMNFWNDPRL